MEKIIVDVSWDSNYGASSDEILGCVALHSTLEGVQKEYAQVLQMHLEGLDQIPARLCKPYELIFRLDVHALLNRYKGVITFKALAEVSGIDARQLGHYAQGKRKARPQQRAKIVRGIQKIGAEFMAVE